MLVVRPHILKTLCALLFFAGLVAVVGSCSKKKHQGIPQSEWERLIAIRTEARQFDSEIVGDEYNTAVLGQPSRLEEICGRYHSVLSVDNIRLVQRIQDSYQPSPEESQVRYLRLFLIKGALLLATCQSEEYLRVLRQQERLSLGKESIPYLALDQLLATETNRERRQRLYDAQLPILQKENAIYGKLRADEDSLLLGLGYGDMTSYLEEARSCDLTLLSSVAEKLIKDTDSLTQALLAEWAPKLTGVQADALRGYDLPLLKSGHLFDKSFPAAGIIPGLKSALAAAAIMTDSLPGLKVTLVDRRDFPLLPKAYPVEIPGDVRLALDPTDGPASYAASYQQTGRALHLASITERSFEFAYLGDRVLEETSASMIEGLLDQQR
jgi:hypothetical protein